jgi:uncharacterized protein with NRDE domain
MCTVTWIPDGRGGHYLTSNRDEAPDRAAMAIRSLRTPQGETLHFPADAGAGGTWFCLSDRKRAACLLNGARRPHRHRPPYRKSRGLVVLDAFSYPDFRSFIREADLRGIEPFTMVLVENGSCIELVWNGRKRSTREVASGEARIWSSAPLYSAPVRQKRRRLFHRFLAKDPHPGLDAILAFHRPENDDPRNGFVMDRDGRVRTLSVTAAHLGNDRAYGLHLDLLHGRREELLPARSS